MLPDGAIAFPRGQGHADRGLDALEDLDVAGNGGFLQEKQVVGLDGVGELNERGGRQGAMGIEHDGAVGADFFAGRLDGADDAVDVGRVAGVLEDAGRRQLDGLGRVIDADALTAGAAQKPVNGNAPQLAGDVPQGLIDARDGVDHDGAGPHVPVRAEQLLPQVFDARGVLAVEQLEQRFGQDLAGTWIDGLDVAPADDAVVGLQAQVNNRVGPDRAQPGDADAGSAVPNLTGGVAVRADRHRQAGPVRQPSQRPGFGCWAVSNHVREKVQSSVIPGPETPPPGSGRLGTASI